MPPKKPLKNHRSSKKKPTSYTIPIYETLSTKQLRQPMLDIMPQVQQAVKQNPIELKVSLLNMLIRVCGLEEYSKNIDPENTIQALETIVQKSYEGKKTEAVPLILDERNKFHKEFVKRVKEFLRALISDEVDVFADQKVQFNQSFLAWLEILTNSKLRAIRSASIHFTKLLLEEEIALYEQCHEKRQSKKAFTISKSISYYLEKILSQRYNDIDQSIRETAFETSLLVLQQLEGDILSEQLLHKIFTPLFQERIEVLDLFMKLIQKLLERCKNRKPLTDYLKEHMSRIIELSRNSQFTGTNVRALKIIETLNQQEPTLRLLSRDYLVSMLENYAPNMLLYGIHAVIEVFYTSLYKSTEELEANSSIVLLEIINLLIGVSGQKHLDTILTAFFTSTSKIQPIKIFNIDNLFNLLMSELYRNERNQDVKLEEKQISILLTIIVQWVKHCTVSFQKLIKEKPTYEKILQTYNTHILINCKVLFFKKMGDHQEIAEKYLALFSHIHSPTLTFSEMENYLEFLCEKSDAVFSEDVENIKVYKEIVNILFNFGKDDKLSEKYSAKSLIRKLPFLKLTGEDSTMTVYEIYRVSALFSKFPIQQLMTSENFMRNLVKVFSDSHKDLEKIEILVILHLVHHYNFMQLFNNTSEAHQEIYKNCRNTILRLYIEILANDAEHVSIKLSAFRGLTFMLKVISSKKFEQTNGSGRVNAYELTNDDMRTVYEFVTVQLFNSDSMDYSSMDLTRMMDKMSLETHEIKAEIIKFLFGLYEESYVFTCHPESVRFLITMVKAEHQFHKELNSQSQNIPLSLDLTRDVERKLNHMLDLYLMEEIKESNVSKLVYWRLCNEIFTQGRDDDKFEMILDKLLSAYFSKRRLDPDQKRKLTNKLMIFILHAVDKILERQEYIQLDVYENIFRKVSRKFEKQVLFRIKEFYIEKTEGIESNYVRGFLETLQSIAKIQGKRSKKVKENEESQSQGSEHEGMKADNSGSDDENQRNNNGGKVTSRKGKTGKSKSVKPNSKVVKVEEVSDEDEEKQEDEEQVQPRRSERSQTKRKIK